MIRDATLDYAREVRNVIFGVYDLTQDPLFYVGEYHRHNADYVFIKPTDVRLGNGGTQVVSRNNWCLFPVKGRYLGYVPDRFKLRECLLFGVDNTPTRDEIDAVEALIDQYPNVVNARVGWLRKHLPLERLY